MVMLGPDSANPKKVAALILARVKPGGPTKDIGESGDGSSPDSSLSEGERAAGEEMISAFHAKDVDALVSAFKSMLDVISPSDDESSPEQEEKTPGFIG